MGKIVSRVEPMSPRTVAVKKRQYHMFLDFKFISETTFESMINELSESGVKSILKELINSYFNIFDEEKRNIIVCFIS